MGGEQNQPFGLQPAHRAAPRWFPAGKNTRFPLADLPRQSVYGRLTGYQDVKDAERLS